LLQNVCESRHPLVRHKLTILRRTDAGDRLFGTKVEEAVRIPRTLEEP
jgi:uracil phosphoribosyltransferase